MVDDPPVEPQQARGWDNTLEKIKCEIFCLFLALIPHSNNDHTTKAVTILFVLTWCSVTLGSAYGHADPDPIQYGIFSALVFYFFGRSHGLEVEWLSTMGVTEAKPKDMDDDE